MNQGRFHGRRRSSRRTSVVGRLVLLAGLALAAAAPTRGASTAAPVRTVVAIVPADWPPQFSLDRDGHPQGFGIDVMEAVAAQAGIRVRYRVEPSFAAATRALLAGEGDLIPNMGITPGRRQDLAFTRTVETFAIRLFVRAGSPGPRGWDDLADHPVGVVRSNVAVDLLREVHGLDLRVVPDVHSALLQLLSGQVDALVYPGPVVQAMARDAGLDRRIRAVGEPLAEIKRAIAVRNEDPELLGILDAAVGDFVGSPEYERIYAAWYGRQEPYWTAGRIAWAAGAVVLALVAGAVVWRYRIGVELNAELRSHRSGRLQAEKQAQESEARLRAVADNLAEGVLIGDLDGRILYVNPRFEQMTGFTADECVGRSASEVLLVPGEPEETILENLARRKEGIAETYETRLPRKGGETLWVEIHAAPFIDASEEVAGVLSAVIDISERKRAEERLHEREEQLQQVARIEAVGRLAGGIAHDFNNLLTAINGYSDLLLEALDRDDPLRQHVESIRRAGESASSLTRQLLTFSRHRVHQPRVFDLNEALRKLEPMLRRMVEEDREIVVELSDGPATVLAEVAQVERVVLNLVVNARDATPGGGRIVLRTSSGSAAPPRDDDTAEPGSGAGDHRTDDRKGAESEPSAWVVLEVSDTGIGMDEAVRSRIFDPFFTTKGQGAGTGLGLATVYGIVRQSGGSIEVESAPGVGTCFRVFLPHVPEAAPSVAESGVPRRPVGVRQSGERTILLVEDEAAVRDLVSLVLRHDGFAVLEAGCGEEALDLMAGRGEEGVDLVLTDLVMPRIGGEELVERLRVRHPDLRVLFTSGYTERGPSREDLESPNLAFLQKPFRPDVLLRTVREMLERA